VVFREALETPFGQMQIAADETGALVEAWLPNRGPAFTPQRVIAPAARECLRDASAQLAEYFAGKRRAFDLPLCPQGSPFEQRVWKRLCEIPYGATTSYGAIAAEMQLLNGARAIGRANGSNPIPIIIPCHRVIGSDGRLTGYGGGLPLKRALLELEGAIAAPAPLLF
jgi:methylated-DNA-[protein]-cysteine S-methyltransferase